MITERQREAQRLRRDGLTYAEIGRLLGITGNGARALATRADEYDRGETREQRWLAEWAARTLEAQRLWRDGLTYAEIGRQLGVSTAWARSAIRGKQDRPTRAESIAAVLEASDGHEGSVFAK